MTDLDSNNTTQVPAATNGDFTAPYTSFSTVVRLIERMSDEGGAPSRMDRSYLSKLPGGAQTIFLASCKTLNLIDEGMHPTPTLEALIDASPEDRKKLVGDLVQKYYPGPLSLGDRATQQQLEEEFRKLGVSGSTLRKAVGFFLNACRFAGIDYSPNFKLPKFTPNGSRSKRKNGVKVESFNPPPPEPEKPAGGRSDLPTLVQGLVERLPADGEAWSETEADQWLEIARLTFPFVYGFKGGDPNP
jgi:uncharacterized protein DUF5343